MDTFKYKEMVKDIEHRAAAYMAETAKKYHGKVDEDGDNLSLLIASRIAVRVGLATLFIEAKINGAPPEKTVDMVLEIMHEDFAKVVARTIGGHIKIESVDVSERNAARRKAAKDEADEGGEDTPDPAGELKAEREAKEIIDKLFGGA